MKRWISFIETGVLSMAGLRIISGLIEISAAIAMLLMNDAKKALAINAILAVVGPIILILTMSIGLISLSGELSYHKLVLIGCGVGLILLGIYK